MKKFLLNVFLFSLLFCSSVNAAEIYSCGIAEGWGDIKGELDETNMLSPYTFYISDDSVIVEFGKEKIEYFLFVARNDNERVDIIGLSRIGAEIFTIDKARNELLYVKNALPIPELEKILDIKKGYSMMMRAKCERK